MRQKQIITLSVLVVSTLTALAVFGSSRVAGSSADWFSIQPSVTKLYDTDAATAVPMYHCTNTLLQVYRGFSKEFENRCMVSTAEGLVEQSGQMIQPPGYDAAYTINPYISGVVIPISNQASALLLRGYSGGPGVSIGVFKDFYSHLAFDSYANRFNLTSGADQTFQYQDHTAVRFDFASLATDPNGRFILVNTIYNGYAKIDTLNLGMKPVATSPPSGLSGYTEATAISGDGKTAALSFIQQGDTSPTSYFKIVNTAACQGEFAADSYVKPTFQCPTNDVLPQLKQAIPGLAAITNISFVNDHVMTFVAKSGVSPGWQYSRYALSVAGQPLSLIQYEALGDSYSSGEGALTYKSGTDTSRNKCHQSTRSYPYLLSSGLNSFASLACSGARIQNIVQSGNIRQDQLQGGNTATDAEKELAGQTHMPGVLPQSDFVTQDNPEAVTVGVGGNDVGFSGIMQKCVNPFANLQNSLATHATCFNTYEDRLELVMTINNQFLRLRDLYESLKTSTLGSRRVYVVGYPQIANVGGSCGLNVQMNASEVSFSYDLIAYLNRIIKQAADEAGVLYVDNSQAFSGHQLCDAPSGQAAVNGITMVQAASGSIDFSGSFHPTALGQRLLADTVDQQTEHLTKPMPAAKPKTNQIVVDASLAILQGVPRSGRAVRIIKPTVTIASDVIKLGSTISATIGGRDFLAKPGTNFTVSLGSVSLSPATAQANAAGDITLNASVPATVAPGFQTLHLYGSDLFGNLIDIQQVAFVAVSENDYDNDGVANDADSCVLAAQSGNDVDHDGIDDVCDSQIESPASMPDDIIWHDDSILRINVYAVRPPAFADP